MANGAQGAAGAGAADEAAVHRRREEQRQQRLAAAEARMAAAAEVGRVATAAVVPVAVVTPAPAPAGVGIVGAFAEISMTDPGEARQKLISQLPGLESAPFWICLASILKLDKSEMMSRLQRVSEVGREETKIMQAIQKHGLASLAMDEDQERQAAIFDLARGAAPKKRRAELAGVPGGGDAKALRVAEAVPIEGAAAACSGGGGGGCGGGASGSDGSGAGEEYEIAPAAMGVAEDWSHLLREAEITESELTTWLHDAIHADQYRSYLNNTQSSLLMMAIFSKAVSKVLVEQRGLWGKLEDTETKKGVVFGLLVEHFPGRFAKGMAANKTQLDLFLRPDKNSTNSFEFTGTAAELQQFLTQSGLAGAVVVENTGAPRAGQDYDVDDDMSSAVSSAASGAAAVCSGGGGGGGGGAGGYDPERSRHAREAALAKQEDIDLENAIRASLAFLDRHGVALPGAAASSGSGGCGR